MFFSITRKGSSQFVGTNHDLKSSNMLPERKRFNHQSDPQLNGLVNGLPKSPVPGYKNDFYRLLVLRSEIDLIKGLWIVYIHGYILEAKTTLFLRRDFWKATVFFHPISPGCEIASKQPASLRFDFSLFASQAMGLKEQAISYRSTEPLNGKSIFNLPCITQSHYISPFRIFWSQAVHIFPGTKKWGPISPVKWANHWKRWCLPANCDIRSVLATSHIIPPWLFG